MSTEPVKINASVNGQVQVDLDETGYLWPAEVAHDIATDIIEAAYQSRSLQLVDEVMAKHRGRFVEDLLEYRVLDAAWRDLRLAFGYDDNPNPGEESGRG